MLVYTCVIILIFYICKNDCIYVVVQSDDKQGDFNIDNVFKSSGLDLGSEIEYSGVVKNLSVNILPMNNSDSELQLNVSWIPPKGKNVEGYSLEIKSLDNEHNACYMGGCYEYINEPTIKWQLVPETANILEDPLCTIKPNCSYAIIMVSHKWDGVSIEKINITTKECEFGICSCSHSEYIPKPNLKAEYIGKNTFYITWTVSFMKDAHLLPENLVFKNYIISIGKQVLMLDTMGQELWYTPDFTVEIPINDTSLKVNSSLLEGNYTIKLNNEIKVGQKLKAKVALVDERKCTGPYGISIIKVNDKSLLVGDLLVIISVTASLIIASVLIMISIKRSNCCNKLFVFKKTTRQSISIPLPLRVHPSWLPLQPIDNNEFELTDCNSKEEHSPLYIEKEIDESGDVYEVTWRRIQLGTLIGKGAFGFVHSAKIILRQQIAPINVAVKLLDNDATPDDRNDFISEIEMMKRVGAHRHVIKLVACVTRGPVLAAVLEIASKGDLLKLLRAAREKKRRLTSDTSYNATEYTDLEISEDEDGLDQVYSSGEMWSDIVCDNPFDGFYMNEVIQVDYASQVASGMQHLETLRITHRDLAARNVLVDSEGILKISDFGLSRNGVYVNIRRSRPVPLRWLAPETIHDASYSTASDVWAYGVLLWEIVTLGSFPYSNLSNDQVIQYVSHGGRLPIPSSTSSKLSTLINLCWRQQHDCRPTFGTILSILAGETNEVLET